MAKGPESRKGYWEELDPDDPRCKYAKRKCYMNFDAENFHDYSELTEYDSIEDFLAPYENSVFKKDKEKVFCKLGEEANPTMQLKCLSCDVSTTHVSSGTECEYEEEFSKRTTVQLFIDSSKMTCKNCGTSFYGTGKEGTSSPVIHDVRLNGNPTKIIAVREKLKCPSCHQRIKVEAIPEVQDKVGARLSQRLLRALAHERILKVTKRLSAQGYGIEDRTVRKHNNEIFARAKEIQDQKDAERIMAASTPDAMKAGSYRKVAFVEKCARVGETWQNLYFTYDAQNEETCEETVILRAAYTEKEVEVFSAWLHGKANIRMPREMSRAELTRFAYYYTAVHCQDSLHPHCYLTAELVIAYARAVQRETDFPREIFSLNAPMLRQLILACSSVTWRSAAKWGNTDYDVYRSILQTIIGWADEQQEKEILWAAQKLRDFVVENRSEIEYCMRGGRSSNQFPKYDCPFAVEFEIDCIIGFLEGETAQLEKDIQEIWGDVFYLNQAVIPLIVSENGHAEFPITRDGMLDRRYLSPTGIPLHCLEQLIAKGLLSEKESSGVIPCSLQRYQNKGDYDHPCENHKCPWIMNGQKCLGNSWQ